MRTWLTVLFFTVAPLIVAADPTLYTHDNPLWHDDDPTNDPNVCYEFPEECTTEHHWHWGWHQAYCLSFGTGHCWVPPRLRSEGDSDSDVTRGRDHRKSPANIRGRPSGPTGGEPEEAICEDPDWYRKCVDARPEEYAPDDWERACWVGYCGCG